MSRLRVTVVLGLVIFGSARRARADMCPYPNDAQDFTFTPAPSSTFELEIGVAFTDHVTVSGGPSSYYWQRLAGNVPPGMTDVLGHSGSTEAPTGSPTQPGSYSVRWCAYPWDDVAGHIATDCLCSAATYNFHVCGRTGTSCFNGPSDCCSGYTCQNTACVPTPDAAVPDAPDVDAPMPDAAMPDAPEIDAPMPDAPDVDAAVPDAATPDANACGMAFDDCTTNDCCAGLACRFHGTDKLCCVAENGDCRSNADCCTPEAPGDPVLTCQGLTCKPPPACGHAGDSCANTSCCQPLECDEIDATNHAAECCAQAGGPCVQPEDCCATHSASVTLTCEDGACVTVSLCAQPGEPCDPNVTCCSGECSAQAICEDGTGSDNMDEPKHDSSCSTSSGGAGGALGGVLVGIVAVLLRRRRRSPRPG